MKEHAESPCPVCSKPAIEKYRPFCCARCADVDLGRWFGESYRVATDEKPEDQSQEDGRS